MEPDLPKRPPARRAIRGIWHLCPFRIQYPAALVIEDEVIVRLHIADKSKGPDLPRSRHSMRTRRSSC